LCFKTHCKVWGLIMLSHVKMAEPTEMQFAMESAASEHVLHRHVDAPTGRGTYLGCLAD